MKKSISKISVIIVSWNVANSLKRCLQSILATKYPNLETIVIDNASSDNSVQVAKDLQIAPIVANSKNLGFPRAVNQGLKKATGDYILLLNPDTQIPKDFFSKALEFTRRHLDMGVMGPKFVDPNGNPQGSVFLEPRILTNTPKYTPNLTSEVNAVSGACMFFPKSTLTKIGLFTEKVFMYYEDLDYCRRIRAAGLKVYFDSDVTIVHEHGQSSKQIQNQKYRNLIETLIYPIRKMLNIPNTSSSSERYRTEAGIWYNGWGKSVVMALVSWTGQKFRKLFANNTST